MADPYHYVRLHSRGGRDVLIVGGEDHRTGSRPARDPHEALERWTRERFGAAGSVVSRWSGQVLEPADGLAFTGRGDEHVLLHTGDSGQGMTHGMIAALLLDDLLSGRENSWAELYAPARLRLRAGPRYVAEAAEVGRRRVVDHLLPRGAADADGVAPGQGALVKRGRELMAVYRAPDGSLHERSAKCTHMGCVVAWNAEDPGWDCACHGSRFDVHGGVVTGPATADLEAPALAEREVRRAG
jgi:nitrite reductase/ring-hydroxylating ferredoxin subunit